MDNQEQFKQALGEILTAAKEHGGIVSGEFLSKLLAGWSLTQEQEKLLYSYLELNRVTVEGHSGDQESLTYLKGESSAPKSEKKTLTGEDSACYQMYLEELESIAPMTEAEAEQLLHRLSMGERAVRERLIEGYLNRVVELAREYAGQGVLVADLIQEGNMALMLALDSFPGGEAGIYFTREICSAMDAAIAAQSGQENTDSYLAAQANAMMKATEELVEELGREATLAEVAGRMNLSEETARDIMKISMDALSVVDANGGGETFGEDPEA